MIRSGSSLHPVLCLLSSVHALRLLPQVARTPYGVLSRSAGPAPDTLLSVHDRLCGSDLGQTLRSSR
ncbi:hypothetical protein VTN02DRAFT_990 [Thermoascus thermophilus]